MKLTGETEVLGENPVPMLLCPPQIPYGLTLGSNSGLHGGSPATNRLSHGTATIKILKYSAKEMCQLL